MNGADFEMYGHKEDKTMKCVVDTCWTPTINVVFTLNYKRTEKGVMMDRGQGRENRDLQHSIRKETRLGERKTD